MKGKKTGGRQKGTPNKTTSSMREIISAHWQRYQESGQFEEDLEALDPATRATIMERYAQYIAPKMKSVDMEVSNEVTVTIEDRLAQLCAESDEDE